LEGWTLLCLEDLRLLYREGLRLLYLDGWTLLYLEVWTLSYLELVDVVVVQVEVVHHERAVEHLSGQTRQEVLAQV